MVAAGGGGNNGHGSEGYAGGSGGKLTGINGSSYSVTVVGGTQTTGHAFGYGQNGIDGGNYSWGEAGRGGGGGGYYGGKASTTTTKGTAGGAGGSSFISGYEGCNAIDVTGAHTNQSNHYSGKVFLDFEMKAGNESMPTHDGTSTMTGNTGNGYAKITYLGTTLN